MTEEFTPPFIQIDFAITHKCNARCKFCKCWSHPCYSGSDIPGKLWLDTVKKIKDFTTIDLVCIGGGEPLLYNDIIEVINGLQKLDITTVVVTNGSLFSPQICKKIIEAGISHIDFSLDSFSPIHNKLRGFPGLFEKSIQAMWQLKSIDPKVSLGVSTLIYQDNITTIPEFTEWALSQLPIDAINFQAYNQLSAYESKDFWRDDPLWPRDSKVVVEVMDYLRMRAKEGAQIINNPLQFEKFKKYFLNPESNLGIKCPAGTFNFAAAYNGNIIGCIAEGTIGNITKDDPLTIYKEKFPRVRQRAASCCENCHFLINCYFPLHWKRWNNIVKDMVKTSDIIDKPGRVILPPEVREITSAKYEDYPALIDYAAHQHLDLIGKYDNGQNRRLPLRYPVDIPCVYLCGDTSEVHRWGVDLDENDFFKQIDALGELSAGRSIYHTVVGLRRTNFQRLDKIYALIRDTRGQPQNNFPQFRVRPLAQIRARFYRYLDQINDIAKEEGIEFRIVDDQLDSLLRTIEKQSQNDDFKESQFLRALGAVCKDVFIGPRYVLLDLAGRCNLDCIYCRRFSQWNKDYWKKQHRELAGFMDFEVVKNLLTEAGDLGVETILFVGGGEPTLHPNFKEIIGLVKNHGLKFNFSTNGALLNLYNQYLVDGDCESVTVSLSASSKRSFKRIRPGSNAKVMQRIEKNVRELASLKKGQPGAPPSITALYAVCKYNYQEIVDMVFHAKSLGANSIWYQLVHLEDFSKDKLYMSKKEMTQVETNLKLAKEAAKECGLDFNSFIEFEMAHYNQEKGDWSQKGLLHQGCFVGWHFSFIHLRREVFMCCGAKTIGILDKQGRGLKDLWFSDTYRRYRNDGLIMHKENPLTIYGAPLYESYCDSCDNHDQNTAMINALKQHRLQGFVER